MHVHTRWVLSLWRCVVFLSKCDPRTWRRNTSCECTSSIMHCVRVLCACAHLHVCAHSLAQKNELTNTHRTTDSWPRSAASMSGETPVSSAWDATRSATAASPPLSRLARMIKATPSALPSPTAAASSACCPSAQPDADPLPVPSMMCVQRSLLTVGSDFTLYPNMRRSELVLNARARSLASRSAHVYVAPEGVQTSTTARTQRGWRGRLHVQPKFCHRSQVQ